MIVYDLKCRKDHVFEAWFPAIAAFDEQNARGAIVCPVCGDSKINKAPMAPNLASSRAGDAVLPPQAAADEHLQKAMRELQQTVEAKFENVGDRFAEEVRRMHYRETDPRNIYGEATLADAVELKKEGIDFGVLPPKPRKAH